MGWWGTALGGTLGLLVGGPVGAVVGAVVGRGLDRGAARVNPFAQVGTDRARLQERFFETVFAVMGYLAKSDGRVSEIEIAFAESVMDRMSLGHGMRRAAIGFFNQGKSPAFDLAPGLEELRRLAQGQSPLFHLFLEIQIAAAYADGEPNPAEREVLERIRQLLQIPLGSYRRLERLVQLQHRLFRASGGAPGGRPGSAGGWGTGGAGGRDSGRERAAAGSLAGAFALLGVSPEASDDEIKRAYRRLVNRHHPDKLASRGLPEEAIRMASQKTQEIIRAYETVTRARGG